MKAEYQTSQVPCGGWCWCLWLWLHMEWESWACKIKLRLSGLSCQAALQSCLLCCLVAQSCPILCNLMDCSPPGSSVHWISQARILEWVATSSSRGSSHAGTKPMYLPHLLHCRVPLSHNGSPNLAYCCCWSVAQLCLTLFDPTDCSTPGLSVPHHLLEFAQAHVRCILSITCPKRWSEVAQLCPTPCDPITWS